MKMANERLVPRLCENSIKEVLRELTNHYLPNVGHLLYI
jgi:hypothetical protein